MRRYKLSSLKECIYFPPGKGGLLLNQRFEHVSRDMIADVFDSELRGRRDITVCFTGHRRIPPRDIPRLRRDLDAVLDRLYEKGFRDFFSGAALGFDVMAAERVVQLKVRHPDVNLRLAIPCSGQSDRWSGLDCSRYERMLYHADSTHVLSRQYYEGCMHVRNRFMVDRSAFCLCFLTHAKGGTMNTVCYAVKQSCPVLNLAMEDACDAFLREE